MLSNENDNYPKKLFHYTSNGGLKGIISSGKLWMTDVRYLNDSSEFNFFLNKFESCHQLRKGGLSAKQKEYFDFCLSKFNLVLNSTKVYLVSFSENGDSLPQWRGYSTGGGFNLGFEGEPFMNVLEFKNSGDDENSYWLKVDYSEENAEKRAVEFFDKIANIILNTHNFEDHYPFLYREFCKNALMSKNSAFESEVEWRFVSVGNFNGGKEKVKIRESEVGVVPYIEVGIKAHEEGGCSLLISEINVGPRTDKQSQELQKLALESYLVGSGHTKVQVNCSNIPFKP